MNHSKSKSRRRGFFTIEMAVALVLLGTLAAISFSYSSQQKRGLDALADKRTAGRLAESALITLSEGPAEIDARVELRKLDAPSEIPGYIWVESAGKVGGHRVSMVGLVPAASLEKGAPNAAP